MHKRIQNKTMKLGIFQVTSEVTWKIHGDRNIRAQSCSEKCFFLIFITNQNLSFTNLMPKS